MAAPYIEVELLAHVGKETKRIVKEDGSRAHMDNREDITASDIRICHLIEHDKIKIIEQ